MAQLQLFPVTSRIFRVAFKHPYFGWLDHESEFESIQAAMDYRNVKGGGGYRYRITSSLPDGSDARIEYKEQRPRSREFDR